MYIILSARSSAMVAIWSVTYTAPTLRFIWWHRRYSSTYRNNPLLKIPFLDQPLSHNSHHLSIVPQCSWPRNTWNFSVLSSASMLQHILITYIFLISGSWNYSTTLLSTLHWIALAEITYSRPTLRLICGHGWNTCTEHYSLRFIAFFYQSSLFQFITSLPIKLLTNKLLSV